MMQKAAKVNQIYEQQKSNSKCLTPKYARIPGELNNTLLFWAILGEQTKVWQNN
jgi:hypothetical protein